MDVSPQRLVSSSLNRSAAASSPTGVTSPKLAERSIEQLAAMMHLTGYRDHSDRLHRRLENSQMMAPSLSHQSNSTSLGLQAMLNLAETHAARGNYAEAVRLYRRVLRADEDKYGTDSPMLIPRLHALAAILDAANDEHEALCVRERIMSLSAPLDAV